VHSEPRSSTEVVLERRPYCYHREYTAERVTTEYDVFGEAYFPRRNRTLLRRLKRYEQKEPFGIDKITISLPRVYFDESHFNALRQQNGISKYLFLQLRGKKVYISFQRELFRSPESYLKQIDQVLFYLYSAGIFKFPISKESTASGNHVSYFPKLDTPEKQVEALLQSVKLEEIEVFFDHTSAILHHVQYDQGQVNSIGKTIYSNDYKKQKNGYCTKSFAKVYNKPESQEAHRVEPTKLENKYSVRIEFTLYKGMMSYMSLEALDCSAMDIIARLTDALAKALHEKAPWIHSVAAYPSLNPVLKGILDAEPKKRLRCSKDFLCTLRCKSRGKIPDYIRKQIKPDPLVVVERWDEFIERKEHYDNERAEAGQHIEDAANLSLRDLGHPLCMSRSTNSFFKRTEFTMVVKPRRLDHLIKQWPSTEAVKFLRPPLYIKEKLRGNRIFAAATGPPVDFVEGDEDTPDTS